MKYIDISEAIAEGMKTYPSDPQVKIDVFKSLKAGGSCNLSRLELGSHTGTHIDAPRHLFGRGKTVDVIPVAAFIRKVVVSGIDGISGKSFFRAMKAKRVDGVLLRCGKKVGGLTVKDARILVENGIKLVGIDRMSIEGSRDKTHPVHKLLLNEGVIIIESLNLKNVDSGIYKLVCLPLKIKSGDGAPARAVLIHD